MPEDLKPKHDEFTAKVVNDPAKPQDSLLLQGFLGASSEPEHTRVYADITLESYVDVANADIIHIEPLPKEQSPLGGSYLWVKKNADVFPGTGDASRAKAKFLEGPIAAEAADASGGVTAAVAQPVVALPRTVPILACHPTIVVRACPPSVISPACPTRIPQFCPPRSALVPCPQTPFCPTHPVVCLAASGAAQCQIPDPTIQENPLFQPGQQFAAGGVAQPQVALQQTIVGCNFPVPPSVLHACPSVPVWRCPVSVPYWTCPHSVAVACPPSIFAPLCPVLSANCPFPQQSIACGQQFPQAEFGGAVQAQAAPVATPPIPASQAIQQCPSVLPAACPQSVIGAICPTPLCPTPAHHCPSVQGFQCPTVHSFHCPSVAGFQCPSVNGFQCPSVAGFHCPSVQGFQCPSVHNFHCPSVQHFHCPPPTTDCTDIGPHCNPTPNPQHCPTPNMMCPPQTTTFQCPSVGEICPTSSPLFC